MKGLHILSPGDAGPLALLHAACFEERWDAPAIAALLARANTLGFAAYCGERLKAFILVQHAGEECEILTVCTAPDARRHGHGRALVRCAAAAAVRRGAHAMFLEVAADNDAARALYAGLGFTVAGRRNAYYVRRGAAVADALILHANLPLPQDFS